MWEIHSAAQLLSFGIAVGFGVVVCLLYDILRAARRALRLSSLRVFAEDVVFSLIAAIGCFCLQLVFTGGAMRLYLFLGIAVGFVLCRVTLSRFFCPALAAGIRMGAASARRISAWAGRFTAAAVQKTARVVEKLKKICKKKQKPAKNS